MNLAALHRAEPSAAASSSDLRMANRPADPWRIASLEGQPVLQTALVAAVLVVVSNAEASTPVNGHHSTPLGRQAAIEAGRLLLADIAENASQVVVATNASGHPVGGAGFERHGREGIEVTSMLSLLPPGSGVGTALLAGLWEKAVENNPGRPLMRLQAHPASIEFYRQAGARIEEFKRSGGGSIWIAEFSSRPRSTGNR